MALRPLWPSNPPGRRPFGRLWKPMCCGAPFPEDSRWCHCKVQVSLVFHRPWSWPWLLHAALGCRFFYDLHCWAAAGAGAKPCAETSQGQWPDGLSWRMQVLQDMLLLCNLSCDWFSAFGWITAWQTFARRQSSWMHQVLLRREKPGCKCNFASAAADVWLNQSCMSLFEKTYSVNSRTSFSHIFQFSLSPGASFRSLLRRPFTSHLVFPSNAFMALARSFNMFCACCKMGLID
jgi:hypothetical protein